jgi:hypothetical protein
MAWRSSDRRSNSSRRIPFVEEEGIGLLGVVPGVARFALTPGYRCFAPMGLLVLRAARER